MIEDLRFVERIEMISPEHGVKIKILQAYDGNVWFDVPLVKLHELEDS